MRLLDYQTSSINPAPGLAEELYRHQEMPKHQLCLHAQLRALNTI